jgi:chalcone isomerase-like protein
MKRFSQMFLILVLAVSITRTADARECEGVTLPNQVTVEGSALRLVGMGVREATVLNVNVYVAGLYLENPTRNATQVIQSAQKKRLILHFVRDVDASDIREAFTAGFSHAGGSAALRDRLSQLNRMMPAMQEGGRLTFTYVPATGLQVQVGARVKGTIPGEDFARAFFGIWFGSNPPNAGLKTGLLGGQCG